MMLSKASVLTTIGILSGAATTQALQFNQDITPNVIFGSGNANGAWTVDRQNGIELGLRAKLRFNASNLPENTFNSNGDGTYSYATGAATGGAGWVNPSTTPIWNFEWSVNSDTTAGAVHLNAYTYKLGIDFGPTAGTSFLEFDPVNVAYADNSLGDNNTLPNQGVEASPTDPPGTYPFYLTLSNVAQNSWNMEFFNSPAFPYAFDPNVDATYSFYLAAYSGSTLMARTDIDVIVGAGGAPVPEAGATLSLLGLAALGMGCMRRRISS